MNRRDILKYFSGYPAMKEECCVWIYTVKLWCQSTKGELLLHMHCTLPVLAEVLALCMHG